METKDDALTEQLYRIFSRYPFPGGMQGCPCCVSDEHLQLLRSKPLRQLGDNELSRFAFKAMTTWGTTEDFKYYLPRIMELYVSGRSHFDADLLMDKLNYGGWRKWPADEQEAIGAYLLNWWNGFANTFSFSLTTMNRLYGLFGDTDLLLQPLSLDIHSENFRNFIDFTYTNYHDRDIWMLRSWIDSKQETMEEAFFHFEKSDPLFARKISDTLYIMDHS
jgi:hypothetical protein